LLVSYLIVEYGGLWDGMGARYIGVAFVLAGLYFC